MNTEKLAPDIHATIMDETRKAQLELVNELLGTNKSDFSELTEEELQSAIAKLAIAAGADKVTIKEDGETVLEAKKE